MPSTEDKIKNYAQILDQSVQKAMDIRRFTADDPSLTVEEGYRIQEQGIVLRLGRGECVVGHKMGLTSQAKMEQMGVTSPIRGVLTDVMEINSKNSFCLQQTIHPKVEPEIAFITSNNLSGGSGPEEIRNACTHVCLALEIIDSRYTNFDFTLADVVADNCSSSGFVISSSRYSLQSLDLKNIRMELYEGEEKKQEGNSRAILGDPMASVIELVKMLGMENKSLPKGSIVLAGAATAAIPMKPQQTYRLVTQEMGSLVIRTK